jgi:hypothetical protein
VRGVHAPQLSGVPASFALCAWPAVVLLQQQSATHRTTAALLRIGMIKHNGMQQQRSGDRHTGWNQTWQLSVQLHVSPATGSFQQQYSRTCGWTAAWMLGCVYAAYAPQLQRSGRVLRPHSAEAQPTTTLHSAPATSAPQSGRLLVELQPDPSQCHALWAVASAGPGPRHDCRLLQPAWAAGWALLGQVREAA